MLRTVSYCDICGICPIQIIDILVFIIIVFMSRSQLTEVTVHYGDECQTTSGDLCVDFFKDDANVGQICNCEVGFILDEDLEVCN